MTYAVMDLVHERAGERAWELVFDSGPNGDRRTIVWEQPQPSPDGQPIELEIAFSPDGRILFSERRRGGITDERTAATGVFASTEICLQALRMI